MSAAAAAAGPRPAVSRDARIGLSPIHLLFTGARLKYSAACQKITGAARRQSVEQLTILITPDGQWVLPDTPAFFAAIGDSDPDYDAVGFAVKNLGFIKFQLIRRTIVEIELHPRAVELAALLAVQQRLLSLDVRLFRIKYFDMVWHSEIASSAEVTVARLSELCAPHYTPASRDRFLVEPQDFGLLFEDEPNQMRPLAQKWRISFGHFDPTIITLAMRNNLLPRLAIIGVKQPQHDPVWRFIGDGHRWLGGGKYVHTGLGEKVAHIPDKDYGEWASGFYNAVAESGKPRYDLVTTSIQYQDEPGKPWRPIRYERLLLPWKTPSDEVFVTMCSKLVSPPSPGREEAADSSFERKLSIS
jgi:hypothetical protein